MTQLTPISQRPDGAFTFVCVCATMREAANLANTIRGIVHAQRNNAQAKLIKLANQQMLDEIKSLASLPPSSNSPIPGGD